MNIVGLSGLDNSVPFKKREFPALSARHYRIAQGFDSAAALVTSEGIQAAVAEERFTREKGTGAFPRHAIEYCLKSANLAPGVIDYVAHGFSYEPFKSLYYEHGDFSKKQFIEVYSREAQLRCLEEHFPFDDWARRLVHVPHHMAHAASTFYPSGFEEALILIADGMGEIHSTTLAIGRQNSIHTVAQVDAPHSLGILYGVFTLYLGFDMALDEYKVMGLAPYGDPRRHFTKLMDLIHLKPKGTYAIPILCQNDTLEDKETYAGTLRVLADLFGPAREPGTEITQAHMDIAAALQAALETSLLHILRHFKRETSQNRLCMAGGVALNCTANGMIKRSKLFKNVFVQPAAGDDGSALGAALYVQNLYEPRRCSRKMALPLWGPDYSNETVGELLACRQDCKGLFFPSFDDLVLNVAKRLADGQVVGWFQGRLEFGPRALGSRSILADPRDPKMRDRLNRLVKQREDFRPFAPAVTVEAASQFFDIVEGEESVYAHMLFVAPVKPAYRKELPAVTHVDGSARIQTVSEEEQPRFWSLLKEFGKLTGTPVILNTSFNIRGQPIVCTPIEAMDTLFSAGLDVLAIENYLVVPNRNSSNVPAASPTADLFPE